MIEVVINEGQSEDMHDPRRYPTHVGDTKREINVLSGGGSLVWLGSEAYSPRAEASRVLCTSYLKTLLVCKRFSWRAMRWWRPALKAAAGKNLLSRTDLCNVWHHECQRYGDRSADRCQWFQRLHAIGVIWERCQSSRSCENVLT